MGAKKFSLAFTDQPDNGDLIFLLVRYDGVIKLNWAAQFYDYFFNFNSILIGATIADTLVNLKAKFEYFVENDWNLTDAICEIDGNTIHFIFGNDLIDVTGNWSGQQSYDYGFATATIEAYTFDPPATITLPDSIVLSRSPYWFRHTPGIAFDRMVINLYIYRGDKVDDIPTSATYSLSKSVTQAGQSTIGFDIQALLNDYVQNSLFEIGQDGSFTSNLNDSIWCFVEGAVYLGDDVVQNIEQQLLAVDGFGYHTELINPAISTKVLSSIDSHIVYNNADYPLYFLTEGLTDIEINDETVTFDYTLDLNNHKIGYVNLTPYAGSDTQYNAVFTYGEDTETHTVIKRTECRYDIINCVFKNKYGFWQAIAFPKRHKNDYTRAAESYQRSISNAGAYTLSSHVKRDYLATLQQKITVNTDFIPETQNALFKELLLSEFVYLQIDGQYLPVNLTSSAWTEKTAGFDRLIQYTLEFTLSHNLMNIVK